MRRWFLVAVMVMAACGGGKSGDSAAPGTGAGTGGGTGAGTGAGTGGGTGGATGTGTGTGTGGGCVVVPELAGCTELITVLSVGTYPIFVVTYDACGRVSVLENLDFGGNGSALLRSTWTYEEATGEPIQYEHDGTDGNPPDGTVDGWDAYVYDSSDRLDAIETWTAGLGSADCVVDYRHNDTDAFEDEIDDGCSDIWTTFSRLPNGLPELQSDDYGRDLTLDRSLATTYDASDRIADTLDTDEISGLLARSRYTWNGDLLTELSFDVGDNGTVDSTVTYAYDAEGRLLSRELDGSPTWVYEWTCP